MSQTPPHHADPVFQSDDISSSQRNGMIIKMQGSRSFRVHRSLLSLVGDCKHASLPTPPSSAGSSAATSPIAESSFVEIPEFMISSEMLLYVGFDAKTAKLIWNRWTCMRPDHGREIDGGPVTFESTWSAHVYQNTGEYERDDAWKSTMEACGVSNELQEAILDSGFQHLRQSKSCRHWILESTRARYRGLEEVRLASIKRADATVSNGTSAQGRLESVSNMSAEASKGNPGTVVLFKGGYLSAMQKVFTEGSSSVELRRIFQHNIGDFAQPRHGPHLSLLDDLDEARHHAAYAKRRAMNASAAVLHIEVPAAFFDSLERSNKLQILKWPGKDCRQLVWHCGKARKLPDSIKSYAEAQLIVGPCFAIGPGQMQALQSPNDVTAKMELRNSQGATFKQYCFRPKGADLLEKHIASTCRLFGIGEEDVAHARR